MEHGSFIHRGRLTVNTFMSRRRLHITPDSPQPAENRWLVWGIPLLVAVLTFVVFLPALDNGFVNWDDDKNFINNYLYRGLGLRQLKWMATTFFAGPYQPLSWLTLGFDYLVWGMDPFGYHLTNVLLHSANAAVFYILCLRHCIDIRVWLRTIIMVILSIILAILLLCFGEPMLLTVE